MATRTMSRRQKLLAFGPALLAIGTTAIVASGASIIPGATAANTLTVNGSVATTMSIPSDTTSACSGTAISNLGAFEDGAVHTSPAACTISFASNSVNGVNVTVADNDAAAPFFKTGAGGTDNSELDNVTPGAGGVALADDSFGIALTATAGTPTPAAGANFEIDGTPATQTGGETIWGPVGAANATICETTALTTATQSCSFVFGVDGQGATQTSGSYTGVANIVAAAKP